MHIRPVTTTTGLNPERIAPQKKITVKKRTGKIR